jgi:Sodium:dicarboxylate symporter family
MCGNRCGKEVFGSLRSANAAAHVRREGTSERNRVQKVLEDANVKLGNVLSDVFGTSGQAMLEALLENKRTAAEIAERDTGAWRQPRAALVILLGTVASFHLPVEPVFIILGIDELMDMARTSVNVLGNCLASVVIARWEAEFKAEPKYDTIMST